MNTDQYIVDYGRLERKRSEYDSQFSYRNKIRFQVPVDAARCLAHSFVCRERHRGETIINLDDTASYVRSLFKPIRGGSIDSQLNSNEGPLELLLEKFLDSLIILEKSDNKTWKILHNREILFEKLEDQKEKGELKARLKELLSYQNRYNSYLIRSYIPEIGNVGKLVQLGVVLRYEKNASDSRSDVYYQVVGYVPIRIAKPKPEPKKSWLKRLLERIDGGN